MPARQMVLGLLVLLGGCRATVGDACDEPAARRIVRSGGEPLYAGQAMLVHSCAGGGTHCHASDAEARYGAPFGMNFDPTLTDTYPDPPNAARHLYQAQLDAYLLRDEIFAQVASGAMPPGSLGTSVLPDTTYTFDDDHTMLPSIRSAEGRELLRNWLACGSPVVESMVTPARIPCERDADCMTQHCIASEGTHVCQDVGYVEAATSIGSSWDDVYAGILQPRCAVAVCHGTRGAAMAGMLDMSSAELAWQNLVGHAASVPECGTRVIAGDPEHSLLVSKIEGTQDAHVCGHRMPSVGNVLSAAQIASIRQWVTGGAER